MRIYVKNTASIEHAETGITYDIEPDELNWESMAGDGGGMGREDLYSAVVEHPQLGRLEWTLAEYPVGVQDFAGTDVGIHRVVSDFDYGLEHEPELDPELAPEPETLVTWLREQPDWRASVTDAGLVDHLVRWFHYYHEDPANDTPFESREGGYQWIHGGPYEARDEIGGAFGDLVSDAVLERAVDEVERDGIYDWAPSSNHPDRLDFPDDVPEDVSLDAVQAAINAGAEPAYGRAAEQNARANVLQLAQRLRESLPEPSDHGGMGHNNPPEEFNLDRAELAELRSRVEAIEE